MQELQTQWEVAVFLIYEEAIKKVLPNYYPFLHLEVVGEENIWDGPPAGRTIPEKDSVNSNTKSGIIILL